MNTTQVEKGMDILQNFAADHGLGAPSKILVADVGQKFWGVGCEWSNGLRTAVAIGADLSDEAKEIERRVRDWKDGA